MIFITWTKCPSKKWASIIQSSHRLLLCSAHSYSTETMCSPEWQAHEFKISKENMHLKCVSSCIKSVFVSVLLSATPPRHVTM